MLSHIFKIRKINELKIQGKLELRLMNVFVLLPL